MATIPHNTVNEEAGKGVEMLRHETVSLDHTVAGSQSPVKCLVFPVDVDVVEIRMTAGLVPTDNAANRVNVFNGTVAGASSIIARNINTSPLVAQVPQTFNGSSLANTRVKAGTPISIQGIFAGDDAAASAQVVVAVYVEIPINALNARTTTYDAYNRTPN